MIGRRSATAADQPCAEFDRAADQITRIIVKGIGALDRRPEPDTPD